jgi:hypothetical protein
VRYYNDMPGDDLATRAIVKNAINRFRQLAVLEAEITRAEATLALDLLRGPR